MTFAEHYSGSSLQVRYRDISVGLFRISMCWLVIFDRVCVHYDAVRLQDLPPRFMAVLVTLLEVTLAHFHAATVLRTQGRHLGQANVW